ncbi:MAG: xanthine dehydrogenase family protein molybdopterin-binding subunit [Acidimicrobiales bacterium]
MRIEDWELLAGTRAFTADLAFDGLEVVFVRSQIAHGSLAGVDVGEAEGQPGVAAVYTADTLGLGPFVHFGTLDEGQARHPLAADRVRHVGEAVAMVVAESVAQAQDAAELVVVETDPLDPIVDPGGALDAEPIYPESGSNLVFTTALSPKSDTADEHHTTAASSVVVEVDVRNNRVASAPMEPDAIIVRPTTSGGLDIWCTSQGVHEIRDELARGLGLEPSRIRVRSPAVGGGFGGRASLPIEFVAVAKAAIELGRPVRHVQSRWENLTSMVAGRDTHSRVKLGLGTDGSIHSLSVDMVVDAGSTAHMSGLLMVSMMRQATGLYRIPNLHWNSVAALTNTTPVGAYRGAGQPEANHARERIIDVAARRLGIDPIGLRRRNLLRSDELPHTAPGGVHYDVADPHRALEAALDLVDLGRWRDEQSLRRAANNSNAIGVGVACYAQTSGRGSPVDSARVTITSDGRALVQCGSASHGQGHLTTMTSLVADALGLGPEDVDFVDSDSDAVPQALTTGGSRATQVLGTALANATDDVLDMARHIAATMLEASADDIVVSPADESGPAGLSVAGVPARRVSWADIAQRGTNRCIQALRSDAAAGEAHPYGTHASVVEVDLETGLVRLLAHAAVDDCGVVLQPELVEGQQHGGSVAGIGQALWENLGYDAEGTPQNAYFATYGLPSAAEVPFVSTSTLCTPTDRNRLGTKGIGENGCNGATAAVHNAVCDALAHLGIEHIDLPLTPESIWQAIRSGSA